jgi:hypothetical protein
MLATTPAVFPSGCRITSCRSSAATWPSRPARHLIAGEFDAHVRPRRPGDRALVSGDRRGGPHTTHVGVDDSAVDRDQAVTFLVYGDGKLLGQSRPLKFGQPPQALSIEVGGVKLIELVARASRPGQGPQPVTWGEAALRR